MAKSDKFYLTTFLSVLHYQKRLRTIFWNAWRIIIRAGLKRCLKKCTKLSIVQILKDTK